MGAYSCQQQDADDESFDAVKDCAVAETGRREWHIAIDRDRGVLLRVRVRCNGHCSWVISADERVMACYPVGSKNCDGKVRLGVDAQSDVHAGCVEGSGFDGWTVSESRRCDLCVVDRGDRPKKCLHPRRRSCGFEWTNCILLLSQKAAAREREREPAIARVASRRIYNTTGSHFDMVKLLNLNYYGF